MNEELTNEVLEAMKKCSLSCARCDANGVCDKYNAQDTIQTLATALLEERAKPKVWDFAPEWVNAARVSFFVNDRNDGHSEVFSGTYTRELPKTRARQIAENIVHGINGETHGETKDVEYVEGVLNKYAEELKGEA